MKLDSRKRGKLYAKRCKTCRRRARAKGRAECNPCRNNRRRQADPVRTAYETLKYSAKLRGKVFTITLEYFRRFCKATDYIKGKGRSSTSYTVDRIREEIGYVPGNLQVLTNSDNVKKYFSYDWQTRTASVVTIETPKNLPF